MTEQEYLDRFRDETPRLRAWGEFVISEINNLLINEHGQTIYERWIKIPPTIRIKNESSLIAKAFILNRGWFSDIYNDITDKVGVRYVVGLTDQISSLTKLIERSDKWSESASKEFDDWKLADPRIFDYQSAHFILTSITPITYNDIEIPTGTKCEIQIRTLLQHAYAELSHDTLYKSNITSEPEVHRLFAKSMALMETTDDMLLRAQTSSLIALANLEEIKTQLKSANKQHLPSTVFSNKPRENDYLIDQLRPLIKENLPEELNSFLTRFSSTIAGRISTRKGTQPLFELEAITLVYYLAKRKRTSLPNYWPFERSILEGVYSDLGIAPPWSID
ncbi:hypothetical protein M5G25_00310 [Pseudomonas sp. TNT2022 ID357]|uniref:RelA/SpoT domain-containing protein n=1 Tax=Pseudomonas idahonensis TaxID=2942628 RepID=A0ABT5PXR1_9PSED|nr:hypothetical protein [Pseudomonas idahonensis]MDD1146704.1 hypothetical protein [Pseudomonas idahonensis]